MATLDTKISRISACSQRVIGDVAAKSSNPLYRMQLKDVNDESLNRVWDSLGKHLSSKLRQGRGVTIPGFGQFTFSAANVNLAGVTNPKKRDFGKRIPVFLVSPQFVNGGRLKTGRFYKEFRSIRPYTCKGVSGGMHSVKCNYTQVGMLSGTPKDVARTSIERVIRQLATDVRKRGACEIIIPTVGVFQVRGGVAAVAFDNGLESDARVITNKNMNSVRRKTRAKKFVTLDVMDQFSLSRSGYDVPSYEGRFMRVDSEAENILKSQYNIETSQLPNVKDFRPMTATCDYDNLTIRSRRPSSSAISRSRRSSTRSSYRSRGGSRQQGGGSQLSSYFQQGGRSDINQLSTQFFGSMPQKTVQLNNDRLVSIAKRKLGLWIRETRLPLMDAFFEIISKEMGREIVRTVEVSQETLQKCIMLLGVGIDEISARLLVEEIQISAPLPKIRASDFVSYLDGENSDPLNHLRDIIYVKGLQFEDIMKTMNITNQNAKIDFFILRDGIRRIDPSMNSEKAKLLAALIMNERNQITMLDLVEVLEGISAETGAKELAYNVRLLNRIRIRLLELEDPLVLRKQFEKMDGRNSGLLDPANFKGCLLSLREELQLTIGEINKLGRYVDKNEAGDAIDYNAFLKRLNSELIKLSLKSVDSLNLDSLFDVENLAMDIKAYLKRYGLSIRRFLLTGAGVDCTGLDEEELKYKRTGMPLSRFGDLICSKIYQESEVSDLTVNYYLRKVDIDGDGLVNAQDLDTFLSRYDLLENKDDKLAETLKTALHIDASQELGVSQKKLLFPSKEVDPSKIDVVLRDLRNALGDRNISFREFFSKLDNNKDGLITFDEFREGLLNTIAFSEPVIKGLFAFMDRQHIGMVDFNNYFKVMKKSVLDTLQEGHEDNFDWQINVIKSIKQWFFSQNLSSEDAFRMVDTDFDQKVNKIDLRRFLSDVLMIPIQEISSPRLDRLFNLLDQYKRGQILYEDFKRVLSDDFVPSDNLSITGGKKLEKHSFDWMLNSRQKIGLYISKRYSSLKACFDEVSGHSEWVTFANFKAWLEPRGILHGFNLTEKLLKALFSDLDPHKKGHLIQNDWANAFSCYSHFEAYIIELKEIINTSFAGSADAFAFFAGHGPSKKTITFSTFAAGVEALLPARFRDQEKQHLWATLTGGAQLLSKREFLSFFRDADFQGSLSLVGKKNKSFAVKTSSGSYTTKMRSIEPDQGDVISRVKLFINASKRTLKDIFQEIDQGNKGVVTNLEFRDGIRKLMIGLTSKDIDDLINSVDMNKDGRVDWIEFAQRFKERSTDWRILDRTRQRLHWIKDHVYIFMLSPKDAFRRFNHDRTGLMTFEHFHNFIRTLCGMTGEDTPSFVLVKDLFNYFDSRGDGVIDINEWLQIFKRIEVRQLLGGGTPPKEQFLTVQVPIKSSHLQHIVLNPAGAAVSKFEISHEFDLLMKCISKNRRYLLGQFQNLERRGVPITFGRVKKVLDKMSRSQLIHVPENCWPLVISFAQKDGFVNYRYLLDRYKQRTNNMDCFPKKQQA